MSNSILFIVADFYSGGAQREMFELDLEFKRRKIDLEILCIRDLNIDRHFKDYYYSKHKSLGTVIHFLNDIIPMKLPKYKKLINRIFKIKSKRNDLALFLASYRRSFFMGEYVYMMLHKYLKNHDTFEVNIFTMSSRFQNSFYRDFPKTRKYFFIDGFDTAEQVHFEYEGFADYQQRLFPLSFRIPEGVKKWNFNNSQSKKIGIFTRYSSDKPLDPFLYAFHVLLDKLPNLEFHVYGSGDQHEAGYTRYIKHLKIGSKVYFHGHQDDIKETVVNDRIDLVWFQGYLNRPAGYAGFDIALTKTPQLFWEFYEGVNHGINKLNFTYPHFDKILEFVNASETILTNSDIAKQIGENQFNDVIQNRDMQINIAQLIDLFE